MKNTLLFIAMLTLLSVIALPNQHANATEKDHDDHDHAESHEQDHGSAGHDAEEEHQEHGAGEDGHEHGGHREAAFLNPEQMALANVQVATLTPRVINDRIYAPGEIEANGYTSYIVSPRVESVVLRRHAALGEHVEKGQPLVTLFSETVAEAQAAYRVGRAEWQRVQALGRKTVGDKRYLAAQTDYEAAGGRLRAFGLSDTAIRALAESQSPMLGEYTLTAETDGAVLSDDFHQGQRVEAGEALMVLADEHQLWVEARLAPNKLLHLPVGTVAQVQVDNNVFEAHVTQEAHTIDPQTRTRVVRLLVNNEAHRLHPGMFADVYFSFATGQPVLAVPEAALVRGADGDWTVFVESHPGEFKPKKVGLGRAFGRWREISGVAPGSRVVMEGAFFVASQIAKGGFDPHNH